MKPKQRKSSRNEPKALVKRCVFYGRVSTDEQARNENNSISTQEKFAVRYIELNEVNGYKKIHSIYDPGFSAKNLNRPGMKELIGLIKSQEIDVIVVYKLDRLTRSIRDFYELWETLEINNVEFASATEQIDTSNAMGRAVLNLLLTFAQFEREMTSQRLCDKFEQEAKEGLKHPGMAPYGYELDGNRSMTPIKEEADFVKLMFQLMVSLKSPAAVAKEINLRGAKTKTRIYKKETPEQHQIGAKPWTADKVKRIIEKHLYKGIRKGIDGKEYKAIWKAVVSEKLWKQANDALVIRSEAINYKVKPSKNKHEMLLKGLLFCGHCGCAMSPKPGGKKDKYGEKRPYYVCQEVIRAGRKCQCNVRNIPGKDFDDFIIKAIGELGRHPLIIKSTMNASAKKQSKSIRPLKAKLSAINKTIKEFDQQISNCLNLAKKQGAKNFALDLLDEAEKLSENRKRSYIERDKIKSEIEFCQRTVTDEEMIAEALCNFEEVIKLIPFEQRSVLFQKLIRKIRVSQIDPKKHEPDLPPESFIIGLRTKWYEVKFEFLITSLFKGCYETIKNGSQSSYCAQNGGE